MKKVIILLIAALMLCSLSGVANATFIEDFVRIEHRIDTFADPVWDGATVQAKSGDEDRVEISAHSDNLGT